MLLRAKLIAALFTANTADDFLSDECSTNEQAQSSSPYTVARPREEFINT